MKISVFIATSLDGFIARKDGAIDWLPDVGSDPDGGEHGYTDFIRDIDYIVMGRNTYDVVCGFESWPMDQTPVIVLSNTLTEVMDRHKGFAEVMSGSPKNIVRQLQDRGAKHLYIDGGKTIQEELITDITITRIPVLIGTGIPLFGPLDKDIPLRLINRVVFANGLDQVAYTLKGH
jgi:dihydrofolate reductase